MAIEPKSSRATLKRYFKKNAIPKESDFAELIDGGINQADDGIAKPDGEPLSLQPDTKDAGARRVLHLYKSFADPKPAWTLSLSPAGKPGFSIGDADGNSRLFVDETSGQVGIGTLAPVGLLQLGKSVPGGLGPVLTLTNPGGRAGAGAAIDFNGYDPLGQAASARLQSLDDGNFSSHLVFSVKASGANANGLAEALRITPSTAVKVARSLGIGLGPRDEPRSALDTGMGLISGAANDYQKAQVTLSGGGLVSWEGPGKYLKWTQRFVAIAMERGRTFRDGHVSAYPPTGSADVTAWDNSVRFEAGRGVMLKAWEALYAVHTVGGANKEVALQVINFHSGNLHVPGNWLLIAVVNGDDNSIRLGTGTSIAASGSHDAGGGSGMPKGAIVMWSGAALPAGWALCDGQNGTPDLRGRFVLGAGNAPGLTARSAGQAGGVERHALSVAEMPGHSHVVSDPGHAHNWTASRQEAGTDDNNNTNELSKGDRGNRDIMSKNTNSSVTGISIQATGGGGAHENMPPFFVLAYIMKL